MKRLFSILGFLIAFTLTAQTGPTQTVNGRVIYNYKPTGTGNTTYLTLNTLTSQLEFQEAIAGLALGETSTTAYRGDRGKIAYDHSQTTGNPHNTQISQISGLQASLDSKETKIQDWSAGTYVINQYVSKVINGQLYSFKSISSSNTTEPLLNSNRAAWTLSTGSFLGTWNSITAYVNGNIVIDTDGYAYQCITPNTNSSPKTLIFIDWIKLGLYKGDFSSSGSYDNGDIVKIGTTVYISNYDNNTYDVSYGVVSKWELINGYPHTVTCWGDSMTFGQGSTGYATYPDMFSIITGFNVDNQGVSGDNSIQVKDRFFANPEKHSNLSFFWVGRNNVYDGNTVVADIQEMTNALPHENYLVLGIVNYVNETEPNITNINTINNSLKSIYGNKFVDLNTYLKTIYDPSIPQDVIDHNNGNTAWSIRQDYLHLNNKGNYYVAKKVSETFRDLPRKADLDKANVFTQGQTFQGSIYSIFEDATYRQGTVIGNPNSQFISKVWASDNSKTGLFNASIGTNSAYIPITLGGGNGAADIEYAAFGSDKSVIHGKLGVGTVNPVFQLAVSNNGGDGFEVAVGQNPDGRVTLVSVDRNAGELRALNFLADSYYFSDKVTVEGEITAYPATLSTSVVVKSQLDSGLATKFNTPTGTAADLIRGDGSISNIFVTVTNLSAGTITPNNVPITSGTSINNSFSNAQGQINALTSYVSKSANYTLTNLDYTVDFTTGTNTSTLPTAVGKIGKRFVIKNSGTGKTTITTTSGQTIDGNSSMVLFNQNSAVEIQSDNTNWKILGTYNTTSVLDATITTTQTAATLNSAYPDAWAPFVIYAPNVGSGMVYIKTTTGGQWIMYSGSILNP